MPKKDEDQISATDLIVEDLEAPARSRSPQRKASDAVKVRRVIRRTENEPLKQRKGKLLWQKGRLIGSGGFGKVFLGLDGNSGTLIAGKEFNFDTSEQQQQQQLLSLQQEIKLMKELNHKNVVKYYGADRRGSFFYIFMEYIPGGSLRSILDQFGALQVRVASSFTRQILYGLDYLHSHQVIHRDIKCANVLVNVDGVVKLADFGSAQFFSEAGGTHGTPFWMPPEVIRGESVGWQADIWSLGCGVLEMMTGQTPFQEVSQDNVQILRYIGVETEKISINKEVTNPVVRDFVSQCLERDPSKRPSVQQLLMHEFINMSRRCGSGESVMSFATSISGGSVIGSTGVTAGVGVASNNKVDGGDDDTPEYEQGSASSGGSGEEEPEPLHEEVRTALVSRAMSFARPVRAPAVVASNPLQPPQPQPPAQAFSQPETTISGSESVVSMMLSVLDVEQKGIEFDVDPASPAHGQVKVRGTGNVVAVQQGDGSDVLLNGRRLNRDALANLDRQKAMGDTGPSEQAQAIAASAPPEIEEGTCMTTMQKLQLAVTLLLVAVIGALIALLILRK